MPPPPPPATAPSDRERLEKLLEILPSFALLAALRLELFARLADSPSTAARLAELLDADPRRLSELLYALAAIGLLTVDAQADDSTQDLFSNSDQATRYLVPGKPEYIAGHQELLALVWDAALKTTDSIRESRPLARKDFATMPPAELNTFMGGLHAGALERGRELAHNGWLDDTDRVLDIGGGSGGLAIALAEERPDLHATVVELPNVAEVTRTFVAPSTAADRVDIVATDLSAEHAEIPLPNETFSAAVMVSFIQVLAPEQAQRALRRACDLLRPGGALYIIGVGLLDDDRVTPAGGALFNLIFLNIYEQGRSYTDSEHRAWLSDAGFEDPKPLELSDGTRVLRTTKPASA